eukprot:s1490_g11.t1
MKEQSFLNSSRNDSTFSPSRPSVLCLGSDSALFMAKEALKVVVRLLPPEITEEELIATVPEAHLKRTTWRSFQAGKRYRGEAKASVNARCYFLFDQEDSADKFIKDYHGHQFVDGQGESFRAVACFAPYAKVPRQKVTKDARDGTIFEDATYKQFLDGLAVPKTFEAPPDPVSELQPSSKKDTPLLNYMKTRAAERRARQEKRERERKRWHDRLGRIDEKPRWRCAECGTVKHLEEDPDSRGTFYCTYCWEIWEAQEYKLKKKKKKSKKAEEYAEEEEEEDWYEEQRCLLDILISTAHSDEIETSLCTLNSHAFRCHTAAAQDLSTRVL